MGAPVEFVSDEGPVSENAELSVTDHRLMRSDELAITLETVLARVG
jgi:hypothetical protein